jgi:hypothetical protein
LNEACFWIESGLRLILHLTSALWAMPTRVTVAVLLCAVLVVCGAHPHSPYHILPPLPFCVPSNRLDLECVASDAHGVSVQVRR